MKKFNYKDPNQLAKFLIMLLVLGVILNSIATYSSLHEHQLLKNIEQGIEVTDEQLTLSYDRQSNIANFQTGLFYFTAIIFAIWTYRISSNAHSIFDQKLTCTPGWAVAFYFIPIINLWRPYMALKESYRAFLDITKDSRNSYIFPLWWFTWILSNIIASIAYQLSIYAEELPSIMLYSKIIVLSDSLNTFQHFIALILISIVTKACTTTHDIDTFEVTLETDCNLNEASSPTS